MNKNLTELVLIVDRSGSMHSMKEDATGGINSFLNEQKQEEGDCNVTFVHFDHEYEFVENGTKVNDVKSYELVPRGSTALLDAVGRTIDEVGSRLSNTKEEDRPGLVHVVIVTDGGENASKERTREGIKTQIEHQQNKYNWKFTFLGANQDSFANAASYGIKSHGVSNYTSIGKAFNSTSMKTGRMRGALATKGVVSDEDNTYTSEEVSSMNT